MNKDEALSILRDLHKKSLFSVRTALEVFFPEFKESEDEKIRKRILFSLQKDIMATKNSGCDTKGLEKCIAWLEKQGKVEIEKPITIGKCKLTGKAAELAKEVTPESLEEAKKKMLEETEPKFKVGDWVVCEVTNSLYQIKNCIENLSNHKYGYDLTNGGYIGSDEVNHYHLWTIQDSKDGDVLADVYGNICIYEKCDDFDWMSYCSLGHNGGFQHFKIEHENEKTYPATKEQRELLFKKMAENGYAWDAEKKELKLLITNGGDFEPELSQEPTNWTEEDEKNLQGVIDEIQANKSNAPEYDLKTYDRFLSWLKLIKQRLQ